MLKVSCLVTALYCLSPCKQAALTVKTVSDRAEQTNNQIASLDEIINNVSSSSALKIELQSLKDMLSGLSDSLGSLGQRYKRDTPW